MGENSLGLPVDRGRKLCMKLKNKKNLKRVTKYIIKKGEIRRETGEKRKQIYFFLCNNERKEIKEKGDISL